MILEQLGWLRCGLSCFEDDKIVWHLLNFYSWLSSWILAKSTNLLVLRQYKNDSIVSLEISCIFTHRAGYWKSAAISKLANTFSQLSRFFVCSSQAICSTLGISNNLVKWLWPRGWTAAPMFVLIYYGRIFGDLLAKPNSLDDIPKPQNEKILVLASRWLFLWKNCVHIVTRFLGK